MGSFERCFEMLAWLVGSAGGEVESSREFVQRPNSSTFSNDDFARMERIATAAIPGFFWMASRNQVFCPLERVTVRFGRTIASAYPACSVTFYKIANTYWTFKVEVLAQKGEPSLCAALLRGSIDIGFCGVFFPTPGPSCPPAVQREAAMRAMIAASRAPLDVEDFIRGNPYLR